LIATATDTASAKASRSLVRKRTAAPWKSPASMEDRRSPRRTGNSPITKTRSPSKGPCSNQTDRRNRRRTTSREHPDRPASSAAEGLASILQTSVRDNAFHLSYPGREIHVDAFFDGTSAAIHTPLFPSGATIALSQRGPRAFSLTTKLNGQVVYVENWQISADGRSLTQSSWFSSSPKEKYLLVYEKQ
jgi:hypothetical protein